MLEGAKDECNAYFLYYKIFSNIRNSVTNYSKKSFPILKIHFSIFEIRMVHSNNDFVILEIQFLL